MKKIYLSLLAGILICISSVTKAQQSEWCLTEILFQEKAKQDPSLLQKREAIEKEIQNYIANHPGQKTTGSLRIIPVVFHVIHEGGAENISKAQIQNQVATLNLDFRKLNADTTDTPIPFQPLAADCEIEFRLAQLDPNGNCTDGITRTFSHLTNNARDNVKALSYWPSNEYLNVWVVKSIENTNGGPGIIAGFAQFPGGNPLTDGIEIRHDFCGSIGTAASTGNAGRVATHEIGHWFNLRHIWGDATCGNDFVADTPPQYEANLTTCPSFPHVTNCSGNPPNGDLFSDYMDYTVGTCQNLFTNGQLTTRINPTLNSAVSGRNNLWSLANLIATGTDGTPPVICVPTADFNSEAKFICEGTTLTFTDGSWNGDPTTWTWAFPGGTPDSAFVQNPSVQYNTPGTYDVTLIVTNSAGTDTKYAPGMIVVSPAAAAITAYPFQEGFETITVPGNDWYITNDAGNAWEQTSLAAHTGNNCMRINNYTGNPTNTVDNFITTSFNLSNVSSTQMIFWRAFAYRSNSSADVLRIYASTNCGQLWSLRYTKLGTPLGTAGLLSSNFVPTASQWDADTVNLASSSVSGRPNVRFKFEYTQDSGNNIYIDDINLDGIVGVNEINEQQVSFNVYPNPSHVKTHISFSLQEKSRVQIKIVDIAGREIKNMDEMDLMPGDYQYDVDSNLDNGVYFVNLTVNGNVSVKKLVID